jgi:CHAT domain-containing protein
MLCLLLSEPFLIALGQPRVRVVPSDLEDSKVQILAQTATSPADGKPEPRVLVAEVVVQGASGKLQEIAYQAIVTKSGQATTRSQLQKDINAIFKTGWFSNVKAVPEDTPKGVRVTFIVQPNPVLRQAKIVSVSGNKPVLPVTVVDESFRSQYGNILNLQTFQAGIDKLTQRYQAKGYVLAKVLKDLKISEDGIVTLKIAEGVINPVIESVRVQFVNSENKPTNVQEQLVGDKTLASVILPAVRSKPGMVFNRAQLEQDRRRVLSLGILKDAKLAWESGKNPQQVAVVLNVQEISGITEKLVSKAERVNRAEADLQRARSQKDSIAEATALRTLAEVQSNVALYQTALKLSQTSNDQAGAAEALKGLAYIYNNQADNKTNDSNNENNKKSIDKEKKKQAISTYQAALKIYQNLNNDTQAAIILNNIGYLFQELEDYPSAIATYRQAAPLFQKLKQPFWQALTLGHLAASYREIDEVDQSLVTHQRALLLWQSLQEQPNQLQSSSLLTSVDQPNDRQSQISASWVYPFQGDIQFYIGTNDLRKSSLADVRFGEAMTILNIGGIYQAVGDYQQALYTFKEALPLLQIFRSNIQELVQDGSIDSPLTGELLVGIVDIFESFLMSTLYADLGWQQQAQNYRDLVLVGGHTLLEKMQQIATTTGQTPELESFLLIMSPLFSVFSSSISNAGSKLSEVQSSQIVIDWINQSMPFIQELIAKQQLPSQWKPYRPWLEAAYNYFLGEELARASKPQEAVDAYRQVLAQWKSLLPLNLQTLRSLNTNTSTLSSKFSITGNVSLISESLSKGLELVEYIPHATVYKALGKALLASGKSQEAIGAHQQAVQILQAGRDRTSKTNPTRTQPTNALNQFLQIELTKISDGVNADTFYQLGKAYAANQQNALALESYNRALPLWRKADKILQEADTYWEMAIVQRQQGNLAQAETQIETAIARIESGAAQISDQQQQKTNPTPQKSSPYKSYINLVDYLASKQNYYGFYIDLLMQLHQQFPTSGYEELAFEASERSHARSLRAMLNRSMRQPTHSDFINLLDGVQAIQLAQVSSSKALQQQILDNKTILLEYALGEERSYLWAVTQRGLQTYTLPKRATIEAVSREFIELMQSPLYRVGALRGAAPQVASDAVQVDAATQLSQILLEPVAGQLGNKRLLIVSDGILHYLPFAALPKPGTAGKNQVPLLVDHEIVSLPSASIQIELQHRANSKAPTKTLAMLADPIFSRDDQRFQHRAPDLTTDVETLYSRLPATRQEASQILALVPSAKRLLKLDAAASRRIAMSPELAQYRIVHFASHGILNSQNPQRSGMVLSIVNDQGALQRSLLSTADVFNLKLSADLVVLSGCTTALGKEIQGEGLIGLTGGLMYAGAKQVVAGLWDVNDDSTALLMTHFYQGMLSQGLPAVAALRAAQLKLWQSQNWQAPYYWAAFTLQGS